MEFDDEGLYARVEVTTPDSKLDEETDPDDETDSDEVTEVLEPELVPHPDSASPRINSMDLLIVRGTTPCDDAPPEETAGEGLPQESGLPDAPDAPDGDDGSQIHDEEGDTSDWVHFSEARQIHLKSCLGEIMDLMDDPRGVHPKLARKLESVCGQVEKVAGDMCRDKRWRKNPRTWKDTNEKTMFTD